MWVIPYAIIALGVILIDQRSKILVTSAMYEGQVSLIPRVLRFTYVENTGAAFGSLSDHRWVFMVLSTIGILAVAAYLYFYVKTKIGRLALALIIGGGIGNMIDRLFRGFVVDFIDFCAFPRVWPWVFNIADAAVCIGAALFIFDLFRDLLKEIKEEREKKNKEQENGNDD